MTTGRLEILVEPFRENDPGPHVAAALAAVRAADLEYDMGPFSTTVDGDIETFEATGLLEAGGQVGGLVAQQDRIEHERGRVT